MRHLAPLLFALVFVTAPTAESAPGRKTPQPPTDFVPGPALTPTGALLTWLEATRSPVRRRLRIPVRIRFSDHRLGLAGAVLAVGEPPKDALRLSLDDSALGISLLERLRHRCPPATPVCAIWLEGAWGPLLSGPTGLPAPKAHPFAVRGVGALVAPGDAPRVHVEAPPR